MAHWRAVLPKSTLALDYEALVDDQERESRRVIAFCGLPWGARCLAIHETERAVRTASLWQVRQQIYRRSVDRAGARYQGHLQPLKDALGPLEMAEGTRPCGGDRSGPGPRRTCTTPGGKICRVRQAPVSGKTTLSSNFKSLAFGPDFAA